MTDHTSDVRADSNPTPDRSESSADRSARADRDPIVVLQVEPDSRSAELLGTFARRLTDRVRVRSVDCASDATDAVEAGVEVDGERAAVDCVVTEQRLPDGTGVDLVERLRGAGDGVPVVFHTTCPSEESGSAAFGAGADAYFEKGSDRGRYEAIVDRIRALVDDRRGREADAESGATSTPRAPGTPGETVRSEE